jgi:hypothetical protein
VQFLALCQIGKLAGSTAQEPFIEPVGFDNRFDQAGVGLRWRRERISAFDHHTDFLTGAPQPHRVRERQGGLVSNQIRVGCRDAIFEKCRELVWAEKDDHLIGTYVDPLNQGEKDDPLAQRRHPNRSRSGLTREMESNS